MVVATDRKKISSYLDVGLEEDAKRLAKARCMSLSTLVSFLLSKEVRLARQDGEIKDNRIESVINESPPPPPVEPG